jgi:hypothetical protein
MIPPTEEFRRELLSKAHLFGHFGAAAVVTSIHNMDSTGKISSKKH